ncbi:hypothetical protein CRI77_02940 [Mycolicibacterium duvalii]|uniref:Polyketide synthase n=1 Tax=Mycolicibacterium duvalii TaxID=39688 RepID=A0A7I7JZH1_9MYCO|nr:hypothetical protein [Mycolicibacterium duvalii]MCV7366810.1 hypothetical protein [Mycolicibacterium duvalii]PEG43937.1 hypothetical protein CRI77_02940 [Mycolicibacterium duvalii]BBX16728.1 polyketide synthase [Mycolicibacterium duvalii]
MVAPHIADEVRHPLVASAPVTLEVFDRPAGGVAPSFDTVRTSPSSELIVELDAAAEWLGVQPEEILLAALGRVFGRTRGDGAVSVDVTGGQRWLHHPVSLLCAAAVPMGPTELLQGAHAALSDAPGVAGPQSEVLLEVGPAANQAASHALTVHVHRVGDALQADWSYDTTRLDRYSVEEMAEQFPLALIEITSDAAAPL